MPLKCPVVICFQISIFVPYTTTDLLQQAEYLLITKILELKKMVQCRKSRQQKRDFFIPKTVLTEFLQPEVPSFFCRKTIPLS